MTTPSVVITRNLSLIPLSLFLLLKGSDSLLSSVSVMANDDPPYLELGTEVSAKYRGAFCEAKVKTLKCCVRVKVNFSKGHSAVVDNSAIKEGFMKIGSKVVVKQPDGTLASGTVSRLTDASVYTVVFDDGDERTLKRSSLVLKGGRHYHESETLDTLPLTNPEYFSTPVGPARKTRKRTALGVGSPSSDSADSPISSPAKRRRKKGFEIGQVVFLENERRKVAWLPAVVVPAALVVGDTDLDDNSTYIRSFKDGRFYAVDAKELHEFSTCVEPLSSILRGGMQAAHKPAIDRALAYIDNGELPWDMDLPADARIRQKLSEAAISKREESEASESSTESLDEDEDEVDDGDGDSESDGGQSDSSDDGEEVDIAMDKKRFMENLRALHQNRGTPILRHPVLGQKDVDLFLLHQYVRDYGGMDKVTQDLKWRSIYLRLGLPPSQTNCSSAIKQAYKRYLLPLEGDLEIKDHEDAEKVAKKRAKEKEKLDKVPVKVERPKGRPPKEGRWAKETGKQTPKETTRQPKEAGRQPKETGRPSVGRPPKEAGKHSKETGRQSLDKDRQLKETGRQSKETGRQSKEMDRQSKETGRGLKETRRLSKDVDREPKVTDREPKVTDREPKVTDRELKVTDKELKVTDRVLKVTDRELKVMDRQLKEMGKTVTESGKQAKETGIRHLRDGDKDSKDKQEIVDSPEKKVDKVGVKQSKEKGKIEKSEADAVKKRKEDSKKSSPAKEEPVERVRLEKKQQEKAAEGTGDSSSSDTSAAKGQSEDSSGLNTESAPEAVPQSREPLYKEDDKVLVWYGRGKNLRTYEAKVVTSTYDAIPGTYVYYVHYNGWNKRYNEWVVESRIHAKASGNVFNEKWQSKYTKRPHLRKSLPSKDSFDEADEDNTPQRVEKGTAKKPGRRPKKLGLARQKSDPLLNRAAMKEEEDEQEESHSTESSPAVSRKAFSTPSATPVMIKTSTITLPPPKDPPRPSQTGPEKPNEETPVDKPSWAQLEAPTATPSDFADTVKLSPPMHMEEDDKLSEQDQEGASSRSEGSFGADTRREMTPLSFQSHKDDSSFGTSAQTDIPPKALLQLEDEAEEELQLTSDGAEGSTSDTDEEEVTDPPFVAEPMEVAKSPSPDIHKDKLGDSVASSKLQDEDRPTEVLPKWIPVPPANEMDSERENGFSTTTDGGGGTNTDFAFQDVISHREKSTSSSSEDVSKTEELPSSDMEHGQSSNGTANSATREDPSATEQGGKKGKGRMAGRGSPDVRRKLKRASSTEGESPRKRIADLPDDHTNPWRVDFSDLPELSATERIQVILDKMKEMRQCYSDLKSAVAHIEKKKRRAKRKERENLAHAQARQLIQSLVEYT